MTGAVFGLRRGKMTRSFFGSQGLTCHPKGCGVLREEPMSSWQDCWCPQPLGCQKHPGSHPTTPEHNLGCYQNQSYSYRGFWYTQGLTCRHSPCGFLLGIFSHLPSNEKVKGGIGGAGQMGANVHEPNLLHKL